MAIAYERPIGVGAVRLGDRRRVLRHRSSSGGEGAPASQRSPEQTEAEDQADPGRRLRHRAARRRVEAERAVLERRELERLRRKVQAANQAGYAGRRITSSEERRVRQACVSTCRSRCPPFRYKQKILVIIFS